MLAPTKACLLQEREQRPVTFPIENVDEDSEYINQLIEDWFGLEPVRLVILVM